MPGLFASERLSTVCPIDLETIPFWVQPAPQVQGLSSGFGWSRITTPQRTFSYLVHSHFPDRVRRPVRLLRFFFPLSTRVYQAHAEGRGCLPFTREAGVVPPNDGIVAIPLPQYHWPAWICSYEDQTTLAAQPPLLRVVSSEQVAHTAF